MKTPKPLLVFLAVLFSSWTAAANQWYVAPSGSSSGSGTQGSPWDLGTALGSSSVQPGDTVWVQAGTYGDGSYQFNSTLTGTSSNPIIVRAVPGQRATVNGGIQVNGGYTWFWGLEITNLSTTGRDAEFVFGSDIFGEGTKFINMVIHDTGQGIGFWKQSVNSELYGNIDYYNGYDLPDRGHGHGMYVQNDCLNGASGPASTNPIGPKNIENNLVFRQFANGTQLYGSSTVCGDDVSYVDNTFFNNGEISMVTGCIYNFWVGAGAGEENITLSGNITYASPVCGQEWNLVYDTTDSSIVNNYFIDPGIYSPMSFQSPGNPNLTMTGNTFYGSLSGWSSSSYPSNTYLTANPSQNSIFVYPNKYETGRANITIFNWQMSPTVNVDVSSAGLQSGQGYEVLDAENFYAAPVATGTYTGVPITIPMNVETAAPVFAWSYQPKTTDPTFGVFVLLPTGGSSSSTGSSGGNPPPTNNNPPPTNTPPLATNTVAPPPTNVTVEIM